jgi:hypothetical protein
MGPELRNETGHSVVMAFLDSFANGSISGVCESALEF